jgi:hypothetical protein
MQYVCACVCVYTQACKLVLKCRFMIVLHHGHDVHYAAVCIHVWLQLKDLEMPAVDVYIYIYIYIYICIHVLRSCDAARMLNQHTCIATPYGILTAHTSDILTVHTSDILTVQTILTVHTSDILTVQTISVRPHSLGTSRGFHVNKQM